MKQQKLRTISIASLLTEQAASDTDSDNQQCTTNSSPQCDDCHRQYHPHHRHLANSSTSQCADLPRVTTPAYGARAHQDAASTSKTATSSTTTTTPRVYNNNKKQNKKRCQIPDCPNVVIDHGVCGRHGGGKKCYIEDCGSRVQRYGLCWKHGGYKMCSVEGCKNRAKTKGTCLEHGGGSRCLMEDCSQSAITNGYCWAHGGGQRCRVEGCRRLAYKIRKNYCIHHFQLLYPEESKTDSAHASSPRVFCF